MKRQGLELVLPYAAWMVLMSTLPATAWAYAVRGAVTLALLALVALRIPGFAARVRLQVRQGRNWAWGMAVGLLVLAVWLAQAAVPGVFDGVAGDSSPYAPAVCGWPLTLAKLLASALVISTAEELFFRKWLMEFSGFGWMVALFALNHWRWDLALGGRLVFVLEGAFAGVAYGLLARRFGVFSSTVAHAVTNFLLGLFVIGFDQWQFW